MQRPDMPLNGCPLGLGLMKANGSNGLTDTISGTAQPACICDRLLLLNLFLSSMQGAHYMPQYPDIPGIIFWPR